MQRRILALGDSVTAGAPLFKSPAEKPPAGLGLKESQYCYWLKKTYSAHFFFNEGVSGQRTDQIHRRLRGAWQRHKADTLIVMGGINDIHQGHDARHALSHLLSICHDALQMGIGDVVLCTATPYNVADDNARQQIALLNTLIKREADNKEFYYCDTYSAVCDPNAPERLLYTVDDIHPDVEGYQRIAGALESVLDKILK